MCAGICGELHPRPKSVITREEAPEDKVCAGDQVLHPSMHNSPLSKPKPFPSSESPPIDAGDHRELFAADTEGEDTVIHCTESTSDFVDPEIKVLEIGRNFLIFLKKREILEQRTTRGAP